MYFQVIVAVSFINNAILDGIAYSFGVLLNKLVQEFHSNASTVSWVGSLVPGKDIPEQKLSRAIRKPRLFCLDRGLYANLFLLNSLL